MRSIGRVALVFALVYVADNFLSNRPAEAVTGVDLEDWCSGYPDSSRPNTCAAYVDWVLELYAKGYEYGVATPCVPEEEPIIVIVPIVLDWLRSHPDQEGERLGFIFASALSKRYPCP